MCIIRPSGSSSSQLSFRSSPGSLLKSLKLAGSIHFVAAGVALSLGGAGPGLLHHGQFNTLQALMPFWGPKARNRLEKRLFGVSSHTRRLSNTSSSTLISRYHNEVDVLFGPW